MLHKVEFEWAASTVGRARKDLERVATATLRDFFHFNVLLMEIHLKIFKICRGGNQRKLVTLATECREFGANYVGLPVKVWTEGTQALVCLIQANGLKRHELKEVVENGPYYVKKHPNGKKTEGETVPTETEAQIAVSPEAEEAEKAPIEIEKPKVRMLVPRLSPREKLVQAGCSDEETSRLMATLATILFREMEAAGEMDVPNTMQVPVTHITRAIMEHMRLPYNAAGNYRGTVGSFYAARITPFGLKLEGSSSTEERYADWAFDCLKIVDFIGGKNQLVALARERNVEVQKRLEEERVPKAPPPTAEAVEEAVREGFLPDSSIFDLALRFLEGRKQASDELRLAEENLLDQQSAVDILQKKIESANSDLVAAIELKRDAEAKLSSYVLAPDILEKIRKARERIDTLADDLGI